MSCYLNMKRYLLLVYASLLSAFALSQVVMDGDVQIAAEELGYAVRKLPNNLQEELFESDEARYKFIAQRVAGKRYEQTVNALPLSVDERLQLQDSVQDLYRKFLLKRFQENLVLPDMLELAEEEYRVKYAEIAELPERRLVSRILVACDKEECNEPWVAERLERLQADISRGLRFSELAARASDDRATANNGGLLSRPFSATSTEVVEPFRDAAFELAEEGDVSPPVQTKFGFHLIKVEQITPARIRPFDEVSEQMIEVLTARYRKEKAREYMASLGPSDNLRIDEPVLKAIIEQNVP